MTIAFRHTKVPKPTKVVLEYLQSGYLVKTGCSTRDVRVKRWVNSFDRGYKKLALNSILLKIGTAGDGQCLESRMHRTISHTSSHLEADLVWEHYGLCKCTTRQRTKTPLENLSPFKLKVKLQIYSYV